MRKTVFTETRIELADRHTTLHQLTGDRVTPARLLLNDSDGYSILYENAVRNSGITYSALAGQEGAVLSSFYPIFRSEQEKGKKGFWRRYLGMIPNSEVVWAHALPLKCKIKPWIEPVTPPSITAKISATPFVLLYPFGWSTWISLRVTGDHTLPDLRVIVEHIAEGKAFKVKGGQDSLDLGGVFDLVASGVRPDAFGGQDTHEREASGFEIVTTVLSKRGPSLSLGGLSAEDNDEEQIRHITRPGNHQSQKSLDDLVTFLDKDSARNYMVVDKLGRFTWMEKLLVPEGRNRQWLACYHHNSFFALTQAWQFEGLLTAAMPLVPAPARLQTLLATATGYLKQPPFRNASVVGFIKAQTESKVIGVSPSSGASEP